MQQLGADRYENTDKYILFPTICHNLNASEASMKLYFYKDSKIFYCYTECGKMSIFSFLKHYYETKNYEYDWFQDIYSVVESCSIRKTVEEFTYNTFEKKKEKYYYNNTISFINYPKGILDIFNKVYPIEWLKDNISKKAMDKYNILYSISQNKIIIPHYDINNNLIGIRGRALNLEEVETFGKYMPIKIENKWYSHKLSLNLYGLNLNKNNIINNGYVYLFESEKSVLQCESFFEDNCSVACCGSSISATQIQQLLNAGAEEIIIAFDRQFEEVGDDEFKRLKTKLIRVRDRYKNFATISFIFDKNMITGYKDSPIDCGPQIFLQLFKERIIL